MKEQNESPGARFTIERFSMKGPFYLQPQQKVTTLQNKVIFYEGQIDPLHSENTIIKQNHMNLARIVSISTEILRNLLPVGNSPAKKLKLEMASIDEIAVMIQADWKDMQETISFLREDNKKLQSEISDWKEKLRVEHECRIKEVKQLQNSKLQLKNQYQHRLQCLQQQITKNKEQMERFKQQAASQQLLRDKIIEATNRQLQLLRQEASCKYNDYQRCIARLNSQMQNNLLEFEQGKKMIKLICEKMMNEKLVEQAEAYEMMLKMKEQEKFMLQLSMSDLVEEQNKKLREKDNEIQTLTLQNDAKRSEIKRLEDEVYAKKEQLMKEIKQSKELQTQLIRANQKNKIFSDKISKHEKTIQQQIEKIRVTIENYEKDLKLIKAKGSEALNQILEEKMKLQKIIFEREKQLTVMRASLETVEQQWKQRIESAKKTWFQKQSQYTAEIAKNMKLIEEEKERVRKIKLEKERELQSIGKQHQQLIKRLQKQFQQNKDTYIKEQTAKIRKLLDEGEQEIAKMKLNHKKQIEAQKYKVEEQIKRLSIELQQKIAQNYKKFEQQRKRYEEQIQAIKEQQKQLNDQLKKAKEQALQHQRQMELLKIEQIKTIKKLQLQNELNCKKWENLMEQQMQSFLKELEIKENQISNLQEQFIQQRQDFERKLSNKDAEIVSMKQHMQRQINSLKDSNGMKQMENRYINELSSLRDNLNAKIGQIEQSYINQINSLNQEHQRQIQELIKSYDQRIQNSHQCLQRTLISLGSQLQKKSTFLNQKYLDEQIDKKLEYYTQEEKFQFIRQKIQQNLNILIQRDNQIANLQKQLQRFQKKIEQQLTLRRKQLEIEKANIINECNRTISKKQEQCRQRVSAIQIQRKAFSEELFKQFHAMKENHMSQFSSLQRKYKELEQLFSIRPSRAEDVTKIKELINIQTKLDQEITIYYKKMETANEIVKYLNLELENYKQTYDIFGPCEPGFHNKTISFADQAQNMIEHNKYKELQRSKEERHYLHYDRHAESPDVKELIVFPEKISQKSQSLVIESKQAINRSRKYSLIHEKLPPTRDRFKTQKMTDRESELMGHAETFMKLIKKTTQDVSIIKEIQGNQDSKKRTYRRRKLKRLTTGGVEHYF